MERKKRKRDEAILKQLALLGEMRKLHEWTVFGQKEAEEEERAETEAATETSSSTNAEPERE